MMKKPVCLLGRRYGNSYTTNVIFSQKTFCSPASTRPISCAASRVFRSMLTTVPVNLHKCINTMVTKSLKKQIIYRGKAATYYQEQLIYEFVTSHDEASTEQWQKLIDQVLESTFGMINTSNIDGKVVDVCDSSRKLELARNYLSFVRSSGRKFNSAIVCAFLRICFKERKSLNDVDRVRIDKFTKFLLSKYKVMDPTVGDAVIKGLILSGKGNESREILDNLGKMNSVSPSTNSAYSIYLIESNQPNEALEYSRRVVEATDVPDYEFYSTWFEYYKNDRCKLDKSLFLLRACDLKVDSTLCDIIEPVYNQLPLEDRLNGTVAMISDTGQCSSCNTHLNNLELTDEEFDELRNEILNRVLVGNDVFQNTNPEELEHFRFQVARHAPFDLVIDGLNVAYMSGVAAGALVTSNMLIQTLRFYQNEGKKLFVIGRKHMCGWPTLLENLKNLNVGYFFMDNISEDDPFIIYSTLYSGKNTCFVTRDLLRSEKFVLPSLKDRILFKRWQLRHQIVIKYMSASGKLYSQPPIDFEMIAQKSTMNGWHLPYVTRDVPKSIKEEHGIHKTWYCLSPPTE